MSWKANKKPLNRAIIIAREICKDENWGLKYHLKDMTRVVLKSEFGISDMDDEEYLKAKSLTTLEKYRKLPKFIAYRRKYDVEYRRKNRIKRNISASKSIYKKLGKDFAFYKPKD